MQTASQTGNTDAYRDALRQAQATLDTPLLEAPSRSQHLHEILDAVAAPWRGLVDVAIEIQDTSVPTSVHAHVEKVTEEAITNSVRHGRARTVHVTVRPEAGTTVVLIDDDGAGPAGGTPGLGATLLTRLSNGQWELDRSDALGGARLRVLLPTRE
jgi:signal transduction histidine kinase